jgi:hypothetical protein
VPKAKKSATKVSAPRVNKSEWIRNQPASMPAKEVLNQAKNEGIKLSIAQIYTARSAAKKKAEQKPKRGRPPGTKNRPAAAVRSVLSFATKEIADLRTEFVKIAMRIGTDEAQRLLDRIIDVQTPSGRA